MSADPLPDLATDAVVTLDEERRIVSLNAAAERLLGLTSAAAAGLALAVPLPGPGRPAITVEITAARTGEPPQRVTARIREAPDVEVERGSADRHRALLEVGEQLAHVGSWEWTPSARELWWSDNLFRIFGLRPREIVPSPEYVFERTHADDRERVSSAVAEPASSGQLAPLDYRIVRVDGSVRHIRATLSVTEVREGVPYRTFGTVQDVTEQRWAEREIAAHYAVATALSEWTSLEEGGRLLLSTLGEAMECVAGTLWVPRGDVLVARVQWRAPSAALPEFEALTARLHLERGVGLPGWVWQIREPINVANAVDAPPGPRREVALREGIRGAVAVPAMRGEEVVAIVELVSREVTERTERLMRSLTGIGYELGQFFARRRGELDIPVLTPRELEVLRSAARGDSARETAARLFVSPGTVRTHLEHIYDKLEVSDKASAVATALRLGLIE